LWRDGEAAVETPSAPSFRPPAEPTPPPTRRRLADLQSERTRLLRRVLSRADLVPDLSSEAAPPSLIPDQCAIRIALPAPPPAELGQFAWERRADGAGVDVCLLPMAAPAGALDCELLEHWVDEMLAAVDGGSRRQQLAIYEMAVHEVGRACGAARAALLRRLWQRAMAEFDTDDADAAARGEAAARQQRQAVELQRLGAASVALRARLAAAEERAASADEMRLRAVRAGRSAEARAKAEASRACRLEAELGALRGLVEAAAALAARDARNGNGEEALRRVSGMLGAAAAARNAKGVEVKAILAADAADADPAERARADLEHLEAREREIASWRPR